MTILLPAVRTCEIGLAVSMDMRRPGASAGAYRMKRIPVLWRTLCVFLLVAAFDAQASSAETGKAKVRGKNPWGPALTKDTEVRTLFGCLTK